MSDFAAPSSPNPHQALRDRAEARQHLLDHRADQLPPAELARVVTELQIHQIELEMQYEELLAAQAEIQAARAQYVDLYEFAPVGYLTVSADGLIEQLNINAGQALGAPRQHLLGRRLLQFVAPEWREACRHFLADVLVADTLRSCELALQPTDGLPRYVLLQGQARPDGRGHLHAQLALLDVDERRRATLAMGASEARFRRLFSDNSDAIVLLQGSIFLDCNAAALRMLGARQRADLVGKSPTSLAPVRQPDGRLTSTHFHEAVAAALQHGSWRCEALMHRLTGETIWLEAVLTPIEEAGAAPLILIMWRDITERNRLAEEVVQQRLRRQQEVLAAILSTQETERKRIAEALHNGVGQLLYASRLSLETPGSKIPAPAATRDLLEQAIHATRTISFELTPGILEDFGLPRALEALVKRVAPSHLPVHLHLAGLAERLPPAVEIAVYRIIQELINNVLKHAHATEATVHVVREGNHLEVSVEDDGQGFEAVESSAAPLSGIGLSGIRNRVALLGGTIAINSVPGRGTIVSIEITV